MVSFSCENCNDTVVKKKLAQHQQRCHGAYFTCIDCNTTFYNNEHNAHTSCITEAQKYEKALYKPKKKANAAAKPAEVKKPVVEEDKKEEPVKKQKESKKDKKKDTSSSPVSQIAPLLKVNKPTNFKKLIKSLSKEQQKQLVKDLTITKNSDDSISLHFS